MRLGLIVPSSNTVAEVDFYRRLPDEVTLHTARMYLDEVTPEDEAVMLDEHLPAALRDLATVRPDVVVFACTSAGALRGNAFEARLVRRIGSVTGARVVVSVAAAVRAAIVRAGGGRVGVATPYSEAINDKIRASLEEDGVGIARIHGMGIVSNASIGAVEPASIVDFAFERFADGEIDLLFVSCTNFRAFEARDELSAELGVPVITSNQVAFEAALDAVLSRSPSS